MAGKDEDGMIEVIQAEFNNPANAAARPWLAKELQRLGVKDPYNAGGPASRRSKSVV